MSSKLLTALILVFSMTVGSAGELKIVEEAAEFETLSLRVSSQSRTRFQIDSCDGCPVVDLTIAPSTRLFVNGEALPLTALNGRTLRSGTVFYLPGDGLVTRIEAAQ